MLLLLGTPYSTFYTWSSLFPRWDHPFFSVTQSPISGIIFDFDLIRGTFFSYCLFTTFLQNRYIPIIFVINSSCQTFKGKVTHFTVSWYNITLSCPTWFITNLHILHVIFYCIVVQLRSNIYLNANIIGLDAHTSTKKSGCYWLVSL